MATRAARIAARIAARNQPRRPQSARQVNQSSRAHHVSRADAARALEMQAGVAWLINWCAQVELDLRRERLAASTPALSATVGTMYGA